MTMRPLQRTGHIILLDERPQRILVIEQGPCLEVKSGLLGTPQATEAFPDTPAQNG